jgi:hypothetical protein
VVIVLALVALLAVGAMAHEAEPGEQYVSVSSR